MLEFLRQKIEISRMSYLLLFGACVLSIINGSMDLYDWWIFDRVLDNCIDEHLYRCDIGETRIYIQYADGEDVGPDE